MSFCELPIQEHIFISFHVMKQQKEYGLSLAAEEYDTDEMTSEW